MDTAGHHGATSVIEGHCRSLRALLVVDGHCRSLWSTVSHQYTLQVTMEHHQSQRDNAVLRGAPLVTNGYCSLENPQSLRDTENYYGAPSVTEGQCRSLWSTVKCENVHYITSPPVNYLKDAITELLGV